MSDKKNKRIKESIKWKLAEQMINTNNFQLQLTRIQVQYFDNIRVVMTLNVPINNQGIPHALPNEHFLLFRSNIEFEVKVDNLGKKQLKGTAFLTSHRIIFVSSKPSSDFWSFDIPISYLYGQNVKFPFFGNTYLMGSSPPFQNLLPGHCHFKLWFMEGGCDAFIKNLDRCIKQVRKFKGNMEQFVQNSGMYNDMRSGKFQYSAFVDPNDPSKVFVEQPKQY